MLSRVPSARWLAAAQMSFRKIFLEDLFDFAVKAEINRRQPLRDVFMHGGFACAEFLGACANCAARFYDIFAVFYRPLLYLFPHSKKSPSFDKILYSYVENGRIMCWF